MTSGSIVTANPYMYKSLPFDPTKDFVAITNVASGPQVVIVNPDGPFKTLQELIAYGKANPGRLTFGSAGIGTQTHLAGENFAYSAGIDMTHVPYKGEAYAHHRRDGRPDLDRGDQPVAPRSTSSSPGSFARSP